MGCNYGYGVLEDKLIELFYQGKPDFDAAENLIKQGADLNAIGEYDDENMLYEILMGYGRFTVCENCNEFEEYDESRCKNCKLGFKFDPNPGMSMCEIIRFFLNYGFDLNKLDGCFGAQCLDALYLSTTDRYMIDATKILLDAGAKNRTTSPTSTDPDETPQNSFKIEASFMRCCEKNFATANIYEAVVQIYQAMEDGRPYNGIDSYDTAIGKKLIKVLAKKRDEKSVFFSVAMPDFKEDNCFSETLYFLYDGGVLIARGCWAFWTDMILPELEFVDVSEGFDKIIGKTIRRFTFDHRSVTEEENIYIRPIVTIEMETGETLKFSSNYGIAKEGEDVSFYEIDCTKSKN
jgi:hypothetical protein